MAHGFSATRTMAIDKCAEHFARAGYVVLLCDHRSLGASDGEPRHEVNIFFQVRGYLDAVDFMVGRHEVNEARIALWGDSISVSEVLLVAPVDQRVAAVVGQVPSFETAPPEQDKTGQVSRT